MAAGRICGQVFQRQGSLVYNCIQSALKTSSVAHPYSVRHPNRLFVTSSLDQSEPSVAFHNFKVQGNESSQKLADSPKSLVEQERSDSVDNQTLKEVENLLLDMGFSSAEVHHLISLQPILSPQPLLAVVAELLLLGMSTNCVLKALQNNPDLARMPEKHIKARTALLRRYGFREDRLNHMAVNFPSIFTLPEKSFVTLEHLLHENCLFTKDQISKILQLCPNILLEEPSDVEYKFQFAYFRMGVKQKEIINSGFFQVPLENIKKRVVFLERLGRYQTPDKKGQTQVVNPKLKGLIRASESDFVSKIALSTVEEYEIFKELLAREEEQAWLEEEGIGGEQSDSENEGEGYDSE